jgi:epoxyqueuosine reductase
VIIAMGNSSSHEYLPVLEKILSCDPSRLLRLHAAWAIGKIGGKSSTAILKNALDWESDPQIKEEISLSLDIS